MILYVCIFVYILKFVYNYNKLCIIIFILKILFIYYFCLEREIGKNVQNNVFFFQIVLLEKFQNIRKVLFKF